MSNKQAPTLYGALLFADGKPSEAVLVTNPASHFPQGTKLTQLSVTGGLTMYFQKQKGGQMNQAACSLTKRIISGNALIVSRTPISPTELFLKVEEKNTQALEQAREMTALLKQGNTAKGKGIVRGRMPAELRGQKLDLTAIEQVLGNQGSS